jgi:hypothetical protein
MYTMGSVLRHGSEKQKQHYLPQLATGALRLQAFGVSEPSVGSDTTKIQTTATRVEGGYVVNGQKIWTSRAEHSDLMLLLARTTPIEEVERKTDGLSVFLLDLKAAGDALTIRPIKTLMNHSTTEVFFENVELPADALIGDEGKGFRYILDSMNAERILIRAVRYVVLPIIRIDSLALLGAQRGANAQRSEIAACSRRSRASCSPASIPESMIASRDTLFFACTRSVSVVRPSASVNVAVLTVVASSSDTPSGTPS